MLFLWLLELYLGCQAYFFRRCFQKEKQAVEWKMKNNAVKLIPFTFCASPIKVYSSLLLLPRSSICCCSSCRLRRRSGNVFFLFLLLVLFVMYTNQLCSYAYVYYVTSGGQSATVHTMERQDRQPADLLKKKKKKDRQRNRHKNEIK